MVGGLETFLELDEHLTSAGGLEGVVETGSAHRRLYGSTESRKSGFLLVILTTFPLVVLPRNFVLFTLVWREFRNRRFCRIDLCGRGCHGFFQGRNGVLGRVEVLPDLACKCLCLDDLDPFISICGIVENDGDFLWCRHC